MEQRRNDFAPHYKRRWMLTGWSKVRALVLLAALAGCGEGDLLGPERPPAVDEIAMQQVEDRLRPALMDFDALAAPAGSRSEGPATFDRCSRDSGQVQQPVVIRQWSLTKQARADDILETTPHSRAAGQKFAADLVAAGWISSREFTPAGQIFLTKNVDGFKIDGTVDVFNDVIFVAAAVDSPAPCS